MNYDTDVIRKELNMEELDRFDALVVLDGKLYGIIDYDSLDKVEREFVMKLNVQQMHDIKQAQEKKNRLKKEKEEKQQEKTAKQERLFGKIYEVNGYNYFVDFNGIYEDQEYGNFVAPMSRNVTNEEELMDYLKKVTSYNPAE